tara:strand:+ start:4338 stop:5660 length:1323 start_codon:yes stop_codon:yes gene_type:complete
MGGGKSYILRWFMVDFLLCMRRLGLKNVEVGVFCETYPSLKDRHLDKARGEFPDWLGRWRENDYILNQDAGIIKFRNLDNIEKYKSAEFASIGVDELTMNTKDCFDVLRTRLRWPGVPHLPFVAATNPGGKGHQWVKSIFLDGVLPDDLSTEYSSTDFAFIPALPRDNPHLTREYFTSLNTLPEMMKRAYLEGDWTVFAGMFFPMFRRSTHCVKPFAIPKEWPLTAAIDPGWASPMSCGLYATDFDGTIYKLATYYAAQRSAGDHAAGVIEFFRDTMAPYTNGRVPHIIVAGRDAWAKKDRNAILANETTMADVFMDHGLALTEAVIDRIPGWWRFRDAMHHKKLLFFDNGYNEPTIQQIESVLSDDNTPEDIDGRGHDSDVEDHALDETRYMLMTIYRPREVQEVLGWQRPSDYRPRQSRRSKQKGNMPSYTTRPWQAA